MNSCQGDLVFPPVFQHPPPVRSVRTKSESSTGSTEAEISVGLEVGLWTGISVVSLVEVAAILFRLVAFCLCCGRLERRVFARVMLSSERSAGATLVAAATAAVNMESVRVVKVSSSLALALLSRTGFENESSSEATTLAMDEHRRRSVVPPLVQKKKVKAAKASSQVSSDGEALALWGLTSRYSGHESRSDRRGCLRLAAWVEEDGRHHPRSSWRDETRLWL